MVVDSGVRMDPIDHAKEIVREEEHAQLGTLSKIVINDKEKHNEKMKLMILTLLGTVKSISIHMKIGMERVIVLPR